jgi:hypothetical protein
MPIKTSNQRSNQFLDQNELDSLREQIIAAIVKGLASINKKTSVVTKITISREMLDYLQSRYAVKLKLDSNEELIQDFRIVQANLKNETDYAKAECMEFALRRSRKVTYKSFKAGKLESTVLSPLPYLSIKFYRNDKKLRK